jgi:hypothetical protein
MEIMKMKRAMRTLKIVGLSSVYTSSAVCALASGHGWDFVPNAGIWVHAALLPFYNAPLAGPFIQQLDNFLTGAGT